MDRLSFENIARDQRITKTLYSIHLQETI
jgi:hypothetical protein